MRAVCGDTRRLTVLNGQVPPPADAVVNSLLPELQRLSSESSAPPANHAPSLARRRPLGRAVESKQAEPALLLANSTANSAGDDSDSDVPAAPPSRTSTATATKQWQSNRVLLVSGFPFDVAGWQLFQSAAAGRYQTGAVVF